ncbi:hypothetical protein ACWD4J_13315 [Streptomyces sp. NPDC002577]
MSVVSTATASPCADLRVGGSAPRSRDPALYAWLTRVRRPAATVEPGPERTTAQRRPDPEFRALA